MLSDGSAKIEYCNVSKVVYKGLGYTQNGTPYYASSVIWNDEPNDNKKIQVNLLIKCWINIT